MNPLFCSFASFWIVLPTHFINKQKPSTDLTNFIMSFISSFDIIKVVAPGPKIFLCIPAPAAAAVNYNGIKTLLANGGSTFFINGKTIFSNESRNLARNSPDCIILDRWIFDSLILADKLLAKALRNSTG